jgi:hypothetical protein
MSHCRPKPKDLKLTDTIIVDHYNSNQYHHHLHHKSLDAGSLDRPFSEIKREIRNLRSNRMAVVDSEDLSDSGIERADDASSARTDIMPNSPRVAPEGAEMDIQIDQLRPHNQQQYQLQQPPSSNQQSLVINTFPENKCQASQSATNSTNNVSFIDINVDDPCRSSNRLSPQRCQDSSTQSINQHDSLSQREHYHSTFMPFSNNTYAAFKKGNVVRGILCPSLTNSFR